MADKLALLRQLELFMDVPEDELPEIETLCREAHFSAGEVILRIGDPVDDFYLIRSGSVRVITKPEAETGGARGDSITVTLGKGQSFGEMGLVDRGARSATVRAETETETYVINCQQFLDLCDRFPRLGFIVMRNIAVDLSFKLRHSNMI